MSATTTLLIVTAIVAVLGPLATAAGADVPGRPLLALAYLLLVPGVGMAGALRLPSGLATAVLTLALSLASTLLLTTLQLGAGLRSPLGTQLVLSAVCLALFVPARRRGPRAAGPARPSPAPPAGAASAGAWIP